MMAAVYLALSEETNPKLTSASPAKMKPPSTFATAHLYSLGLLQDRSQLATRMKRVEPMRRRPAGLVTNPTPGLGNIALAAKSAAVKRGTAITNFERSTLRNAMITR